MNPDELRAYLTSKIAESRAVIAQAQSSGRLTLNDEETVRFQAIQGEITNAKATLEAIEAQAAHERWGREPSREAERPEPVATLPTTAQMGFSSFGEMLQAVVRAGSPRGNVDRRLLDVEAAAGASEMVPSDGGYLVGTDIANELMNDAYDTGVLARRVRHTPISANSNGLKINTVDETSRANGSRFGGVVAYWTGEGEEKTASRPKFRQMELTLNKLTGLFYATDELLQDAAALESIAREAFASEFGFKLDDAIIRGTGAGMPMGILNSPAKVEVAKETGQVAGTIVFENVINMWARLPARSMTSNDTVWLVNQNTFPQLATMAFAVGVGGVPVWMPAGGISGNPFSSLMGRPVIPIEQASTVGTVGDIMLVDLSQYRMIDKGGIQTASSIHVRFIYDETTFRWVLRTDGQPAWSSALTPANGSATVSPYVTLATRA